MALRRVTLADLAPGNSNVAQIIMEGGRAQADAVQRGGDAWANAIGGITGTIAGGVQKYGQEQQQKKVQDAVRLATSPRYPSATKPVAGSEAGVTDPGMAHMRSILDTLSPEDRPLAMKGIQEIQAYGDKVQEHNLTVQKLKGELADAETKRKTVAADYGAGLGKQIGQWLNKPDGGLSAALFGLGHAKAIGTQGLEEVEPMLQGLSQEWDAAAASGSPEAMAAAAEKNRQTIGPLAQKLTLGGSPEWQEKNRRKTVNVRDVGLVDEGTGEVITPVQPKAKPVPAVGTFEDYVLRKFGDKPSSAQVESARRSWTTAGREPEKPPQPTKLRGVTSGDAGKISAFDQALDQLNEIGTTLSGNKATGAAAQVGAALPNVITEMTGWGEDAKKKQAVINRVKQIIGKTLEGGVLRKEDEEKYKQILPTIGDDQDVAASKIEGLFATIQQNRQTHLDSLGDAGYDVSKYAARAPRERQAPETAGSSVSVLAPDGKTYRFKSKAQADVFKKRAGIK